MDALKKQWAELSEKFAKLSEREKWLTTIAGWIAILFLLFTFVIEPIQEDNNAKRVRIASLQGQIGQLQGDIAMIKHKLEQDPNDKWIKSTLSYSQKAKICHCVYLAWWMV
ncbi:type II secretion system protein GspM [Vibrio gangliei]|uniref:type II secretion system protein GspM n=1 Tax=Vibrio gangliei TaxID=2077090 RepID=UPI000D0198B2|nr:type II secretion system protein GspM [Vibrio gangliei]